MPGCIGCMIINNINVISDALYKLISFSAAIMPCYKVEMFCICLVLFSLLICTLQSRFHMFTGTLAICIRETPKRGKQ